MADDRADIEHHVRTELTTISIASQLIQRDNNASERQRRLAREISQATSRLERYLDIWFSDRPSE